jgi:hypothetical protein
MIEQHAQGKFTAENGYNRLNIAGLSFAWPSGEAGLEMDSSSEGLHARDITLLPATGSQNAAQTSISFRRFSNWSPRR